MLREVERVRQVPGESRRRWFTDAQFDLMVWLDAAGDVAGFQLSYDKPREERALTWLRGRGYGHNRVDDGEQRPDQIKATPILVADGAFDAAAVAERFAAAAAAVPQNIRRVVLERLRAYPREAGGGAVDGGPA